MSRSAATAIDHDIKAQLARHADDLADLKPAVSTLREAVDNTTALISKLNDKLDKQTSELYAHIDNRGNRIEAKIEENNTGRSRALPTMVFGGLSVLGTALIFGGTVVGLYVAGIVNPMNERITTVSKESASRNEVIMSRLGTIIDTQIQYREHERQTYADTKVQEAIQKLILDGRIGLKTGSAGPP